MYDFSDGSDSKESACNAGDLGWENPLEKGMAVLLPTPVDSTPVLLPGESHSQQSVVGYSPWSHEELDTTE